MKNHICQLTIALLLAGFLLPRPGWAAEKNHGAEPAVVSIIRKIVHDIDGSLTKWQEIITDDGCEGDGCSKRTVWLDQEKNIRKIVSSEAAGPATSDKSSKRYAESYFDSTGNLLFRFLRNEDFQGQERISVHEDRFYMQQRKLVSWKTDDHWHKTDDPEWLQTEVGVKSAGDAELSQVRDNLKRKRQ
jgi:hypothetical protein